MTQPSPASSVLSSSFSLEGGTPAAPEMNGDFLGRESLTRSTAQLGLWSFLATVTMLFAAFTSAYIVRGARPDWQRTTLPALLWFNTALLLASSATLEVGRARSKTHGTKALKRWVCVTTLLGLSFVLGQLLVWRKLVADGVYVQSNPHSSFLYILTGLHGVHLLGGVLALAYLFFRTLRASRAAGALGLADLAEMCATYWHFLSGLWVFLFIVLFT